MIWSGIDGWRAEMANVVLAGDGLTASGTQVGIDPLPYRADYRLETAGRFVTRRLEVEAAGAGWRRRIELRLEDGGGWSCEAASEGAVALPPPGGDADGISGALDCDLGFSPLTNTMPVRRHGLDRRAGAREFLMAWISMPDLAVHAFRQRYEHVRAGEDRAVVRYVDLGTHRGFEAELEFDGDGLVIAYPGLARRLAAAPGPT